MRFLFLLPFVLANALSNQVYACSCMDTATFYQVASHSKKVALVKVIKYLSFKEIYNKATPMSMEVEIIHIIKGAEQRKRVIIWGDNGMLCRPYLSVFKEGVMYVMALDKGNPGRGHKDETESDYAIGNCGTHWLTYDEKTKTITGRISDKVIEASIQQLEMLLKEAADISNHEPQIAFTNRSFPLISFSNTTSLNPFSTKTFAVSFPNC
jgi:hypothetical protein